LEFELDISKSKLAEVADAAFRRYFELMLRNGILITSVHVTNLNDDDNPAYRLDINPLGGVRLNKIVMSPDEYVCEMKEKADVLVDSETEAEPRCGDGAAEVGE